MDKQIEASAAAIRRIFSCRICWLRIDKEIIARKEVDQSWYVQIGCNDHLAAFTTATTRWRFQSRFGSHNVDTRGIFTLHT